MSGSSRNVNLSVVKWNQMRFVITTAPNENRLPAYVRELRRLGVKDLVRACEITYEKSPLESEGVQVHELEFSDGDPPPPHIIKAWLKLVEDRFGVLSTMSKPDNPPGARQGTGGEGESDDASPAIAIHCIAGLGRAPVLVAIALIEAGFAWDEAIKFIRAQRKGAVNKRQLEYLGKYKRTLQPKSCCVIL